MRTHSLHLLLYSLLLLLATDLPVWADTRAEITGVDRMMTCFVPGDDCQGEIVRVIDAAQVELYVQAYSFTSAPIAQAVVRAQGRGVHVIAVLDKSQRRERYSGATYLANAGVPVWIDERPAIAHNKVIVADRRVTITGSFNFTQSAQTRNAENLIVISDARVAEAYARNIESRLTKSTPYP